MGEFMQLRLLSVLTLLASASCTHTSPPAATPPADDALVRNAIEAEIAKSVEATRTQNIEANMECIPEDWVMQGGNGERVTRDQLRANVLRWSIIPRTLAQRWERLMLQRDGRTRDTVLTT